MTSSVRTPATSVARCMTLDRCSTNGASGTFIDEQCGASASATERTAYSCSSRSLDERASDAASARSCASSPVRRIVPARTREVTRPFSQPHQQLRRRADEAVDREDPACCRSARPAAAAASGGRSARRRRRRGRAPGRPCRARPALIRSTAAATAPDQCAPESAPSAKATSAGAGGGALGAGSTGAGRWAPTPIVVSHHRPPRRPTTTSGTTSVAPLAESAANEIDPKATGPVPGSRTSSRTTACATTSRHHRSACGEAVARRRASNVSARAPADQARSRRAPTTQVAGVGRGQERQQGARVVERPRCGHQRARAVPRRGRARGRARTSRPASLRRTRRAAAACDRCLPAVRGSARMSP